jgi:riboflavin-specific deaminase-like protein
VIIAVSRNAPPSRVKELEGAGAKVLHCGAARVSMSELVRRLYRMGICTVLLEGGGTLNWSMLKSGLVDEVRVTIAPALVGGEEAVTLVEGAGIGNMDNAIRLSLESMSQNDGEVTLTYKVKK